MIYKIINDFNGASDSRQFETLAEAEQALETDRKEFFAQPENSNSECRLTIVAGIEADLSWTWDPHQNRYRWW